ncbi:glyoxalase/bleomycin resistance protein/dioxygenase, partial [Coprinopsis marcescibilis]
MPLNHLGITSHHYDELHPFYSATLKPLGYAQKMEFMDGDVRGYGAKYCAPDFWLARARKEEDGSTTSTTPPNTATGSPLHFAFTARTRNEVRAFYDAAIAAGGKCNGPPGVRPQYFFSYYGAFILDPEGRNIEAVCLKPGFWAEEWSWPVWAGLGGAVAAGAAYWF